jgi:murein L,D-transpeptidase YcbB/YkuD
VPGRRPAPRLRSLRSRAALALLALGLTLLQGSALADAPADSVASAITQSLPQAQKLLSKSANAHGAADALQQVYASADDAPLWSRQGEPSAAARALLGALRDADSYGLRAEEYAGATLTHELDVLPAGEAARAQALGRLDTRLSATALHFIADLHFGRVSPEAAGFKLEQPPEPFDLAQALRSIAQTSDVDGALTAVEPAFYHYKLLKDALGLYRKIAQQHEHELAPLPPIKGSVKPGEAYAGAAALRRRLELLGDLAPGERPAADEALFDADLSAGLRKFQTRHGLNADGVLGKGTLAALNVPLAQRIRQISLTLERWRWLAPFKTPPIIVNIPQFQLFAFRTTEDRVADILQMPVIVGRTYANTQTPVFEGDMRYVVLRPYWDVPYSITKKEMLPKIHANPSYLARQHLELVNGQGDNSPVVPATLQNLELLAAGKLRLRQDPGEDNALGLVKFMFPNSYNVYLHSTPAHQLFKESVRAFSHGCIRVADPLGLATLVLKDAPGDWTREKIQAVMNGTTTSQRINLTQPINVLILYATALATEGGPVLFFEDLYGYDKKLERQLGLAPVR